MNFPRLPRKIEALPECEALKDLLSQHRRLLWENGTVEVPSVYWSAELEQALVRALGFKQLERGLERIEQVLGYEKKGLVALQEKQGAPSANRVSRVLLIANDGAERFYRACESALLHHQDRVLGLLLDINSTELGHKLYGPEKSVKALLVSDKEASVHVLLSLLGRPSTPRIGPRIRPRISNDQ
jgi:hypothetical protein